MRTPRSRAGCLGGVAPERVSFMCLDSNACFSMNPMVKARVAGGSVGGHLVSGVQLISRAGLDSNAWHTLARAT